jgi:hypothetical protein
LNNNVRQITRLNFFPIPLAAMRFQAQLLQEVALQEVCKPLTILLCIIF